MVKMFSPKAVFYKDEDGFYQAFSPNVKGAISYGETLEEARENIREAIEGVILTALEKDFVNYFKEVRYKPKKNEILETIDIEKKYIIAVSIKIARERAGYTQKELAKKIGVKQQNISRYEKGLVIPSAERFLQLIEL